MAVKVGGVPLVKSYAALFDERTVALSLLAGGILAGIALPSMTMLLQPFALPALFFVVVFSLIPFARLPLPDLLGTDRRALRLLAWQQLLLPCLVIAAGIVAKFPDEVIVLMIVTACAGSLFASPMLAELLDLDRRHAVRCMVLTTLATPISLFCWLGLFQGESVPLQLGDYLSRTALFLALPFSIIGLYRVALKAKSARYNARADSLARWGSVLALLIFGLGMTHSVTDLIEASPLKALFFLGIVSLVNACMFAVTVIAMHRYGLAEALTSGILSGFRNVGLGFALVGEALSPDLSAYIGLSMLPMFIAPALIRFMTFKRQLASRVAGSAPMAAAEPPIRAAA
jgi:predicted Na+-dependent transporter